MVPYTTVEGAEGGTGNVTLLTSAGYSVYATGVAASGSYSFHLAQPDAADQFITLNAVLLARADSQLTFMKRLGYAGSGQVLRAQISANGGTSWQNLWSQTGSGGAGESGFSPVSISLRQLCRTNRSVPVRLRLHRRQLLQPDRPPALAPTLTTSQS